MQQRVLICGIRKSNSIINIGSAIRTFRYCFFSVDGSSQRVVCWPRRTLMERYAEQVRRLLTYADINFDPIITSAVPKFLSGPQLRSRTK